MRDTGSTLRERWPEAAWGAFAAANLAAIVVLSDVATVPFHLIWISLTVLYGMRRWSLRTTAAVLGSVMAATLATMWVAIRDEPGQLDELTEIPLMAAVFLAMVWHARRRQAALEEVRRLVDAERERLEREKEFIRDASHELRTPITVARGHAELIAAETAGSEAAQDAGVVLDELDRLARTSERLLLLTGIRHPDFLRPVVVSVEPLVVDVLRRWGPTAYRRWEVDATADGWIHADPDRLRVALDALIENAVRHTSAGDRICVHAGARGGELVLEVTDDGDGVPAEQLDSIFVRFSRGPAGRTGGMGLGLAIVKAIVEAHGGTVEAESGLGRGTTFRISLPGFVPAASARETGTTASAV